ncbi:MAG: prepilin-type N-terminal cleavage/methylation domain-containing protein, partial [Firmicutes bacterium]|nr:prepilin-type N-terminal cleavage/methylation domain-containing protein [Bacillota bacterium]
MQSGRNRQKNSGFTLAELMVVVATILILAAVSFVGIQSHSRSLAKLQYDDYAREIFITAQNRLAMEKAQNYPGCPYAEDFGTEEGNGVWYVVAPSGFGRSTGILNRMLPEGSIDGTVRQGSYIIRYHKESGEVLDVFCWPGSATDRYAYSFSPADYANLLANKSDAAKMKAYGTGGSSVIGWYGGAETADAPDVPKAVKAPTVWIDNGETLTVTVRDNNGTDVTALPGYRLTLTVKGANGGEKSWTLTATSDSRVSGTGTYTVVLDGLAAGFRFFELGGSLVPGDDVTVQATAANGGDTASSDALKANSLFGEATDLTDPSNGAAEIAAFRHLENLGSAASKVNYGSLPAVWIGSAFQTKDLDGTAVSYVPVTPGYALLYDGRNHTVSNVSVSAGSGAAGLFGSLSGGSVSNLKLVDFTVSGGNAGALAGTASGTTVRNVFATTSSATQTVRVTGSAGAGGLIGNASDTDLIYCASSLVVRSSGGPAGGLAGSASDGSTVTGCYSGGRTTGGKYGTSPYNVTGATQAGGLIGSAGDTAINGC